MLLEHRHPAACVQAGCPGGALTGGFVAALWQLEVRQLLLTRSKPAWHAGQEEEDEEVLAVIHGSSPDQPHLEQFREGRDESSDASVQGTEALPALAVASDRGVSCWAHYNPINQERGMVPTAPSCLRAQAVEEISLRGTKEKGS